MTAQHERADHEWRDDPIAAWLEDNLRVAPYRPAAPWREWLAGALDACLDRLLGAGVAVTNWVRGR